MEDHTAFDIDPELLAGFVDEAQESLATLDSLFVKLEANPADLDIVNAIFRPVHTVKGNSAFFGFLKVKKLAHEMETSLDLAKQGKLVLDPSLIGVLLQGVDQLRDMLRRARDGQAEVDDEARFNELLDKIVSARKIEPDAGVLWAELSCRFRQVRADLAKIDSSYAEKLDALVAVLSRIEANKPSFGTGAKKIQTKEDSTIPQPLREIKTILDRHSQKGLDPCDAAIVLDNLTALKGLTTNQQAAEIINDALSGYYRTIASDGTGSRLLSELLRGKIDVLLSLNDWKTASGFAVEKARAHKGASAPAREKDAMEARKTMRVTEESIDNFLTYVGELIAVGEMYDHLQQMVSADLRDTHLAAEFRRVNETFDCLSDNLQKSIMEIRKVSVRVILQKLPRMVRDLASTCGKQVRVEIHGENTEIDKRLLETLDGPLTHMVRNAVDHGVETPEERRAAGKPTEGTVRVGVSETSDYVTLTISDDGKGLNIEAIKAKAIALGLLASEQQLTEDEIIDTIFAPGVSTAQKVTEVSGRGIGMDVVKRNITEANGKISIETRPGQGTTFTIQLPKTVSTQIIAGFLIKLAGNRYVIPMDKVQEVFHPEPQQISSITSRDRCVLRRGRLLPVAKLADIFESSPVSHSPVGPHRRSSCCDQENLQGTMVAIKAGNRSIALYVDEVISVQKVVLKELTGLEVNLPFYTAAAAMGDGTVAMVLDIDRIVGTR